MNLLQIHPIDQEGEDIRLDITKTHGLGLTIDELAIECCIEDRRVLACEILVDNEALLVGFDADL